MPCSSSSSSALLSDVITTTSSSPSTTSSTTAAAQIASLYLQHQKQFLATSSAKNDIASEWARRSTFTTAATSQQTFSTPSVMSTQRYSNAAAAERDEGLYSMSSVSVDLGESAARAKQQHHQQQQQQHQQHQQQRQRRWKHRWRNLRSRKFFSEGGGEGEWPSG